MLCHVKVQTGVHVARSMARRQMYKWQIYDSTCDVFK